MGAEASRIFLSYRREDTRHMAGRLADHLNHRFGLGTVFMDVDDIEPGADFTRSIAEAVSSCDLLIALIGQDWLAVDDRSGQPRLHGENDFVAIEIKAALDRGIRVIPVLVDQARMPTSSELPAALRSLAMRHATRVDHESFSSDIDRFLTAVDRILRTVATERAAPPPQQTPPVQPSTPGAGPTGTPPGPTHVPSDRPRQQSESQQIAPGRSVVGFIGAPEPDTGSSEHPTPRSGPRIPPARVTLRIVLWWVIYVISMFTAFGLFQDITGRSRAAGGSIFAITFLLCVIGGTALLLRREIRLQQRALRQSGPDGEVWLAESAVSARHVRKVSVICVVVSLGFGLAFLAVPTSSTPSGGGTSTAP